MNYRTFGVKVDAKGNYTFGPEHSASSRHGAAIQRQSICSEMNGKDRVYSAAITFLYGALYRRQTIAGPVS